jgi:uncharacterized protein with PIN domain
MSDDDIDVTQRIPRKYVLEKTVPTLCSKCGKIFKLSKVSIREGKRLCASKGICPECSESTNYVDDRTQMIPKNDVDDRTIPSVCSYCGKIYKIDTWVVENGKKVGVTHGLCKECFEKMKNQISN